MLKELRNQHRTIIQMAFSGFKNKEIAERLSMTESTISGILRSPLGQAYMGGLHDKAKENTLDVRKQLVSMNSSALQAFERILAPTGKAPYAVQFNTARDILDRNGFKPTDKINIDMTLKSKSDQEIDAEINALQNSIAKAKAGSGDGQIDLAKTVVNALEESSENLLNEQETNVPHETNLSNITSSTEDSSIALNCDETIASVSPLTTDLADELTKTSVADFPPR